MGARRSIRAGWRLHLLAAAVAASALAAPAFAQDAKGGSATLDALKRANAANVPAAAAQAKLSAVREAALRETARVLGAQAGLGDESRRILKSIQGLERDLDATYRFSELVMGGNILPPVISEARDAVAVEATLMYVSSAVYRIDEPARPVFSPPTWRDWLLVGLNPDLKPVPPTDPQLLPRDEVEQAYWTRQLDDAYKMGVQQAQEILEVNNARLKRTYKGMRLFFDLKARGMVTEPKVVASTSLIDRQDKNTVAIGTTVFKIVQPTDFVEKPDKWKPLGR